MQDAKLKKIIQLLSQGEFLSGQIIAQQLEISRTAVWKLIQRLEQQFGLDIYAVSGKGYCVRKGLDLLQPEKIQALLSDSIFLDFHYSIDSTNRYLLEKQFHSTTEKVVCLVEHQSAGKGRRGKSWFSGFARNIELSIGCFLPMSMQEVSGISLACGVALAELITSLGVDGVSLKWPNDLHVDGKKLAGILVEVRGETEGPVKTVIGVGLNVDLDDVSVNRFDTTAIDLKRLSVSTGLNRTVIATELIRALNTTIEEYSSKGLSGFLTGWSRYDQYMDQKVSLHAVNNTYSGIYRGINEQGMMLLESDGCIRAYGAGEVSLRREA